MRKCITALLCALLTAAVLGLATPGPAQAADGGAEAAFVAQLNGIRASRGLAPLAVYGELTGLARAWSDQMARNGGISHNPSFDSQVSANWRKLGENVGVGSNVDELVQAFVNSPAHYRNIVDPAFNYIGVGVSYGSDGRMYTTHDFMTLDGGSAPAPAPAPEPEPEPTFTPAPAPAPVRAAPAPPAPVAAPVAEPEPAPVPAPPAEPIRVRTMLLALRALEG
ncbi:MAG: CAP domain-containing protein [Acidimicrobiales bacterium]